MRVLVGFLTTLISSSVAIVFLISLSPVFSSVGLLEPEIGALYTPATQSLSIWVMSKGWVFTILFIVVAAVVSWGLQIFRREELEEEEYYYR